MRILIVDDDVQIREALQLLLKRQDHQVFVATNGEEALKIFRDEPADLVITDIIMPGKEGLETILELRERFPGVKIIAISGGGRVGPGNYLKIAMEMGADQVLVKPFKSEDLLEAIEGLSV